MWMCVVELANGAVVHLYKHVDTRSYLRLDIAGHAYRALEGDCMDFESSLEAIVGVHLQSEALAQSGELPHDVWSAPRAGLSQSR